MVTVYCALSYETPWNALSMLQGMILLAGVGAATLLKHLPKVAAIGLIVIAVAQLGWQARASSFQYASDPSNRWAYAHTGTDVFLMIAKVKALAAVYPAGNYMPIQIVTQENLWPLPWYLRRYPATRWWKKAPRGSAALAPVILVTPDMEPALLNRIYEVPPRGQREMYVNMFDRRLELRPGLEVRGYVAKSLWDRLP
jgi:predicted membrane-bound mannosyltransferase